MEYEYCGPAPPSSHHRVREATTCHGCGTEIGPRERRVTWRIRDGADVFEHHYCSDACLPDSDPDPPSPGPR